MLWRWWWWVDIVMCRMFVNFVICRIYFTITNTIIITTIIIINNNIINNLLIIPLDIKFKIILQLIILYKPYHMSIIISTITIITNTFIIIIINSQFPHPTQFYWLFNDIIILITFITIHNNHITISLSCNFL